ncbi:hemolymph lipopolysaccharide-binding protein-like isoform 1-T1 [Aphomia sociella]
MCYRKDSLLFHSKQINICDTFDNRYVLSQETGKCYKFHNNCKTWRTAYMICAAEGGHLAVVNSYTEARVIKEIFAEHTAKDIFCEYRNTIILGFWDWSHDNTWFTIHGETLEEAGYDEWSNGSPDNKTHGNVFQQCGGMFRSGLLDDVWCDDVVLPFVCEKSPRK